MLEHSGLVARYDWEGVYAVASSRVPRDVRGQTLAVRFEIIDKRPRTALGGSTSRNIKKGPYSVAVKLQVHPHCCIKQVQHNYARDDGVGVQCFGSRPARSHPSPFNRFAMS